MAVELIPSVQAAIEHINAHGSAHTDVIVTEDVLVAEAFLTGSTRPTSSTTRPRASPTVTASVSAPRWAPLMAS